MENKAKGNISPQFDAKGAFVKACMGACVPAVPAGSNTSNASRAMLALQLKVFAVLPVGSVISRSAIGGLIKMPMGKGGWQSTTIHRTGNAVSNTLRRIGLVVENSTGSKGSKEYYYTLKRAVLDSDYNAKVH